MDKGAHYHKCDFQVHTPRDINWHGERPKTDEERKEYAIEFINACREKGLNAVAITDHHDFAFFPYIKQAALNEVDSQGNPVKENDKITVFPGLELTLANPACQAILILDANFPEDLLDQILTVLNVTPNKPEIDRTAEVARLTSFKDINELHEKLDERTWLKNKYIVIPNVNDGGNSTILRDGFHTHFKSMPCIGGYVDGKYDHRPGAKNKVCGKNQEWGRKRLAIFQTSDNRHKDFSQLGLHTTWIKWATPTAEAIRQACLAQDSRITLTEPILPGTVIKSIGVSNCVYLGPIQLELNSQFNAFIGGRGTGKSTLLEYLRWALCDNQISTGEGTEVPDYQRRRCVLIEKTLKEIKGIVDVDLNIHGVNYVIRRHTESNEISIKEDSEPFRKTTEEEVRTLFPIQAYSQKQLSNVSVRIEELENFIQTPIRDELSKHERTLSTLESELREEYQRVYRNRELHLQLEVDYRTIQSLKKQSIELRNSLTNLTPEDKKIVDEKPVFDEMNNEIISIEKEISQARIETDRIAKQISIYPTLSNNSNDGLAPDCFVKSKNETIKFFAEINEMYANLQSKIADFSENFSETQNRKEWNTFYTGKLNEFTYAQERLKQYEGKLQEIAKIDGKVTELQKGISTLQQEENKINQSHQVFSEKYTVWRTSLNEIFNQIRTQCENLSQFSEGDILAETQIVPDTNKLIESICENTKGTNVRKKKWENLKELIDGSNNPFETWMTGLKELEQLAIASNGIDLNKYPLLARCGLNEDELMKFIGKFNSGSIVNMLLIRPINKITFKFKKREGEYIAFENASAGQQATSLLKTLLNQSGPPLIIDQPEDDLDNPIIFDIVTKIWSAKSKRQIIFASHNANIVVNGDAENVICFEHRSPTDRSSGLISCEGAIDIAEVRDKIKRIMEGGEEAFKLRHSKYGF